MGLEAILSWNWGMPGPGPAASGRPLSGSTRAIPPGTSSDRSSISFRSANGRLRASRKARWSASRRPARRSTASGGSGARMGFRRTQFGVLTLLRTAELGPFTSGEIRLLVFALGWASERLSTRRLMEAHELEEERAERDHLEELKDARDDGSALYVLDQDYAIALAWSAVPEETAAVAASETRLPHRIEQSVRRLTRNWSADPATRTTGVARPTPFLVVLTQPLAGQGGYFIGVVIQLFKQPHSLTAAAAQFAMSPRSANA